MRRSGRPPPTRSCSWIRGYQRRTEQYDDLLAHHAIIVVNPHRGKKPIRDFRKLRFYQHEKEAGEPDVKGDTEYAGAWLAAVKQREASK